MKKKLAVLIMLFFLQSCAQEKQEKIISKDQRIDFLQKKIQIYQYQPNYYLDYFTINASEIYVNDLLVYSNFTDETFSIHIPLSSAIPTSGLQKKLTI